MLFTRKNAESAWWERHRHQDRRLFLLKRMRIKSALRKWFLDHGFIEVETSCLQTSPGNETHLHAFATQIRTASGAFHPLYLHTSPEFACKKLIAAGELKIFTFATVFRNMERSKLHHPEFTMLEWYAANIDYEDLMDHCHQILKITSETTGSQKWSFEGNTVMAVDEPERIKVADAFLSYSGIDIMSTIHKNNPQRHLLAAAARSRGIRVAKDDTWSDIFSRIIVERIEPKLNNGRPVILDSFPICEAALSRASPNNNSIAERFELYCCGVELANAFGELTDPVVQRQRFEINMAQKLHIYGESYPIDEELLLALSEMPPTSGCAIGFDRLVMLATGAQRIDQVIWTPQPKFR